MRQNSLSHLSKLEPPEHQAAIAARAAELEAQLVVTRAELRTAVERGTRATAAEARLAAERSSLQAAVAERDCLVANLKARSSAAEKPLLSQAATQTDRRPDGRLNRGVLSQALTAALAGEPFGRRLRHDARRALTLLKAARD